MGVVLLLCTALLRTLLYRACSTPAVTGKLNPGLTSWDALRAALPAGTVSGAPKVRAMQIIDELEVNRRGPYGGGVGHVSFTGVWVGVREGGGCSGVG